MRLMMRSRVRGRGRVMVQVELWSGLVQSGVRGLLLALLGLGIS